jgi:hypothetical protein
VEITNCNGEIVYRGATPVTTRLKTGGGFFKPAIYEIKLTVDGYQTKIIPVQARLNAWYFGNIVIGGVLGMLIIDPITGAMYKFSDTQAMIDATLVPNATSSVPCASPAPALRIIDIRDIPVDQRAGLVRLPG